MATNVPPHNLGEVIDGTVYLMDNPDCTVSDLMEYIKGPDFPTCATIYGKKGIVDAYETGHGRVMVRSKAKIEELFGGECILTKKTKSGEKEVNITDYIKLFDIECNEGSAQIHTILASGNEMNLSPELIIEALRKYLDILTSDKIDEYYSIMRNQMLDSSLNKFI